MCVFLMEIIIAKKPCFDNYTNTFNYVNIEIPIANVSLLNLDHLNMVNFNYSIIERISSNLPYIQYLCCIHSSKCFSLYETKILINSLT